ncbi:hypothetical protein [Streptomyces sp. BA2]|uniref:hypothetical protein n=1 Tax=Streptomyces sp. BA2 TaxID=436595 RepID=UPI0013232175|nr:hypothetical protein [Streptomyces sp. BA2]MWA14952.1 hypothetical protein [Streptomyces sp. BA2]
MAVGARRRTRRASRLRGRRTAAPSAARPAADPPPCATSAPSCTAAPRRPPCARTPAARARTPSPTARSATAPTTKTEGASYDLIVYRNERAAERAFAAWESYARNNKHELKILDGPPQGESSISYAYKTAAKKNTQTVVIFQGKYIGTLELRDTAGNAAGRKDLLTLSEVFATRLVQATRGETPTATAANVRV